MKKGKSKAREAFARQENHAERQQEERSGILRGQRVADVTAAWKETGNAGDFVRALESRGYLIARGDRRAYVVVDLSGEIHSLARQIEGVRTKQLRERLTPLPIDKLPSAKEAQAWAKQRRLDAEKERRENRQKTDTEKAIEAFRDHQRQRREKLDNKRVDMLARQMGERDGLKAMQEADLNTVAAARLAKKPKGLVAFITRITGIKRITEAREKRDDADRSLRQQAEREALQRRHERELTGMDRHYHALDRLEVREEKSIDTALKRDRFQQTLSFLRKAPIPEPAAGREINVKEDFTKAAKPPFDLTEEFNRRVDQRLAREKDDGREPDGPDRDPNSRN